MNVVPVLAADAQARQPWLAMPFVAGPTLVERVRRQGPLRGAGPFGRGAPEAIAARALRGEPDLAAFAQDADPVLHDAVTAALRKDPDARPTAYEVMARLVSAHAGAGDPIVAATGIIHRAWGADPTVVDTDSRDEADGQGSGRRTWWRPLVAGAAAGSVLTAGVLGFSLAAIGGDDAPRSGGTDRGHAGAGRASSPSVPRQSPAGAATSATDEGSRSSNAFQGPNGVSVRTAKVGDALTLKSTVDSRLRIAATVTRVVQDARSSGFPLEGQRLVAVRVTLKNVGDVVYRDAPINGAHLIDDRGGQHSANAAVSVTAGGSVAGGLLTLTPGSSHSGYFVFPVPKRARAATKFQFALDSGIADDVGEWRFPS